MARLLFFVSLLVSAAAFTAPRAAVVARPETAKFAEAKPSFDTRTLGLQTGAALTALTVAESANAFSASYLPAILVRGRVRAASSARDRESSRAARLRVADVTVVVP